MANTVYIKQPDGSYKKVTYIEKEVNGKISLVEDTLPIGEKGLTGSIGDTGLNGLDGRDGLHR
jgi:hypothetical protein